MESCVFCEIIADKVSCEKVLEDRDCLAFKSIDPQAQVHILVIPKRHVERPEELTGTELESMFKASEEVAQIAGIKDSGYKLCFNVGKPYQHVPHVHLHVLGGSELRGYSTEQ